MIRIVSTLRPLHTDYCTAIITTNYFQQNSFFHSFFCFKYFFRNSFLFCPYLERAGQKGGIENQLAEQFIFQVTEKGRVNLLLLEEKKSLQEDVEKKCCEQLVFGQKIPKRYSLSTLCRYIAAYPLSPSFRYESVAIS